MKRTGMWIVFLVVALIVAPTALAQDALYVVRFVNAADEIKIELIEDLGYDVDVVSDQNIASIDFSDYAFFIVNGNTLSQPEAVPVNTYPSLVMAYNYVDDWHLSESKSQVGNSQPLEAFITDPTHPITQGVDTGDDLYTTCCNGGISLSAMYLSRFDRANSMPSIVSNPLIHQDDAIITVVEPGYQLLDGEVSNSKTVFFGLKETEYWTPAAETLFQNAIVWLASDNSAPVISTVSSYGVSPQSQNVTWSTDDQSNSTIRYGTTSNNLFLTTTDEDFVRDHGLVLENLIPETRYYYQITSCNADGFCSGSAIFDFVTGNIPDTSAPVVSQVLVTFEEGGEVHITWNTDDSANSSVAYGTTQLYGSLEEDSILRTQHEVVLLGLDSFTTYYYEITTCNQDGYCSLVDGTFTSDDTTPPAPVSGVEMVVDTNSQQVVLSWDTIFDAQQYRIYKSSSPTIGSFNFNSVDAVVTTSSYEDVFSSAHAKRYYVIRAVDGSGNEETNTNVYGKYDIPLQVGTNLLSFPLIPLDTAVDSVMYQTLSYAPVDSIQYYDAASDAFIETRFDNNRWEGFSSFDTSKGYLFDANQDAIFTLTGTPPSGGTVILAPGLNLIGFNTLSSFSLPSVLPSDGTVREVATQPLSGDDDFSISTYYTESGWYSAEGLVTIQPGNAYYITTTQGITLSYS